MSFLKFVSSFNAYTSSLCHVERSETSLLTIQDDIIVHQAFHTFKGMKLQACIRTKGCKPTRKPQ